MINEKNPPSPLRHNSPLEVRTRNLSQGGTQKKQKYTDYAIISGLSSRRGKRDFVTFIDQELEIMIEDTPENRVWALQQINGKSKTNPPNPLRHNSPLEVRTLNLYQEGKETSEIIEASYILTLESDLIGVLADMENRGVAFDRAKLVNIGERIRCDITQLENEIYDIIGGQVNINSPKQLQVLFFETLGIKPIRKNKTGYSVDVDVLEEIAKTHDVARLILEYRGLMKLSGTYVDGLMRAIDPRDGRIHTTYDSLGAATGRMSSNDPNLQNIPTGDGYAREIKECFVATPFVKGGGGDFVSEQNPQSLRDSSFTKELTSNILLVADYSQVEIRVLAFLSQDQNLLSAFQNGEDIHMRTAKFLFGEDAEITSSMRRIAKSVNFGVIYGITGFGLAKTLECNTWEAQKYVDAFYEKYPGVRVYYDNLLENARKNGYVETYFGRRRYIPGVNDANKTMRSIAEREAMNMPVQGTAADMIKIAMIELDTKIREKGLLGSMILQVHDELVFDIPLSEKDIFEKMVREVMEGVLEGSPDKRRSPAFFVQDRGVGFGIDTSQIPPIVVDISTGENWAEAK